ncbi:MAG: right-handed parallel beta-helix repeat-containing protein [Phycisphaerales bacterium]
MHYLGSIMRACSPLIAALAMVGFAVATANAQAQTYYVRSTGNDANSGLSPALALRTIQAAVGKCTATGGGKTIYVGPGTYNERIRITNFVSPMPASGASTLPNSIIGDTAGAFTNEAGGPVIISGGNSLPYGIEINARHYWKIDGLTFTGQTAAGVYVTGSTGIGIRNCMIRLATSTMGIYSDGWNCTIEDNTIQLGAPTGSGIFQRCMNPGSYSISRNRIYARGVDYLASNFRTSTTPSTCYGIYFNVESDSIIVKATIENNVVTDRYTGCYVNATTLLPLTVISVSSNTIVGCTYPFDVQVDGTSLATAQNNLVAKCYYGGRIGMPLGTLNGMLICGTVVGLNASVLVQTGVITAADPMFVNPSQGNFALAPGSPAIDRGVALGAPTLDVRNRPRPADGDGDAVALPDLGAYEYQAEGRFRIVSWFQKDQRAVPRYKLPDVAPVKLGDVIN